MAAKKHASEAATPILNAPYEEPRFHCATAPDGNLDYQDKRSGRRILAPDTPRVPPGRQPQAAMFERTLKVEIDDEAFERVYGFKSHPIPVVGGRRVAVRVVRQFGEESTKVVAL